MRTHKILLSVIAAGLVIGFVGGVIWDSSPSGLTDADKEPPPSLANVLDHGQVNGTSIFATSPSRVPTPKKKPLTAEALLNFKRQRAYDSPLLAPSTYSAYLSSVCTITFMTGSTVIKGTSGCTFEKYPEPAQAIHAR